MHKLFFSKNISSRLQSYSDQDIQIIGSEKRSKNYVLVKSKIISEAEMRKMKPDYLFILPWHFSTEFYYREKELLKDGTKLIVPLPELSVLE